MLTQAGKSTLHTSSWMLGSAPLASSTLTTLMCPSQLARARAVLPSCGIEKRSKAVLCKYQVYHWCGLKYQHSKEGRTQNSCLEKNRRGNLIHTMEE